MPKQASIKDIARLAGVSPGTVDRILHNRGNVSAKRREAVEKALEEAGYKLNIHTSAVSYRKELKIVITTPTPVSGGYWDKVWSGFDEALKEFADIDITCLRMPYDQFSQDSCENVFSEILGIKPDAVVIGPTFEQQTLDLCSRLDEATVPYVFVDAAIEGTSPQASFTTDQNICGALIGRLLFPLGPMSNSSEEVNSLAILSSRRSGSQRSNNSIKREDGLIRYLKENNMDIKLERCSFSATDIEGSEADLRSFFESHPEIKNAAVLNSQGHIVAGVLKSMGRNDVKLISFENTDRNRLCLMDGSITALLCQRPSDQGFNAIHHLMEMFIYNTAPVVDPEPMPIDIVVKETLPCYRESARLR